MKKLLLVVAAGLSLMTLNASASSDYLDSAYLSDCRGSIELRKSANGDLNLIVEPGYCSQMKVYDYSSRQVIKSYSISSNKASYTLSKEQLAHLGQDCKLGIRVTSGSSYYSYTDDVNVVLNGLCQYQKLNRQVRDAMDLINMLSGGGYRSSAPRVTYEWSNKHNCKKMIDGKYSGENVADYYCH